MMEIDTVPDERQKIEQPVSIAIPFELEHHIRLGRCVIVLGDDHELDGFARSLATELEYTGDDMSLPTVAQVYHDRFGWQGREQGPGHELLSRLERWIDRHPPLLSSQYALLARSPIIKFVSFSYGRNLEDNCLEVELRKLGRNIREVVEDVDLPFGCIDQGVIAKPLGTLDRLDSVLITEDDYRSLFVKKQGIVAHLRQLLATDSIVLLHCNLGDRHWRRMFSRLIKPIIQDQRRLYTVGEQNTPADILAPWQALGARHLALPEKSFLEWLARQALVGKAPRQLDQAPGKRPYKFLEYYEQDDAELFFGRDDEAARVTNMILAGPLTVLYGRSGVGKTSLLKAAVIPRLEKEGWVSLYVRIGDDPILEIQMLIVTMLKEAGFRSPELSLALQPFLQQAAAIARRRLVICIDQFEEFFVRLDEATRKILIAALHDCLHREQKDIKLVFSLREDFLAELQVIILWLPYIFHTGRSYRLKAMDRERAYLAICEPARLCGLDVDSALVEALLGDLSTPHGIEPAQLSIVCDRLYDKSRAGNESKITLKQYEELGKSHQILASYVDHVLEGFSPEKQDLAKKLLKNMATSRGTKSVLRETQILIGVKDKEEGRQTLVALEKARLVRSLGQPMQKGYELAHDYLVDTIQSWIDQEEMRSRAIVDMIRRELRGWHNSGLLIATEKLAAIHAERDSLGPFLQAEELAFVGLSAAYREQDAGPWLAELATSEGDLVDGEALLLAGMRSEDGQVRQCALEMLARLWKLPALADLGSPDAPRRQEAAQNLGYLGDEHAVEPLVERLRDEERTVCEAAAKALQRIGPGAAAPLVRRLADADGAVRFLVASALRHMGWTPPPDRSGAAYWFALREVEKGISIGAPAVQVLTERLDDRDPNVRQMAAEALGRTGDAGAVGALAKRLGDVVEVRQAAAMALGSIGDAQAVEPLARQLSDESQQVREAAAEALQRIGPAAVEPLVQRLWDVDGAVRFLVASVLQHMGWTPPPDRSGAAYWFALGEIEKGIGIGVPAVGVLTERLGDPDPYVRQIAAAALGRMGSAEAVGALAKRLGDDVVEVRQAAAMALGSIGDAQAVEPLARQLSDESQQVREAAAEALQRIGPAAVEPLVERLMDADGGVRPLVASALQHMGWTPPPDRSGTAYWFALGEIEKGIGIGAPAVGVLTERLGDPDPHVRQIAAAALGRMGSAEALERLVERLGDSEWQVRQATAEALGRIGSVQAVEALVERLDDDTLQVRQAAAQSLGQLKGNQAETLLVQRLRDRKEYVRQAAAYALGQIGNTELAAQLVELLKEHDQGTRLATAMALKQIADVQTRALEAEPVSKRECGVLPPEARKWTGQPPIGHFITTYELGDDAYDDSFDIETPAGGFLGECGVNILETIGSGQHDKVTAFEVWLFDASDTRTVTKVLMSDHAYSDDALRAKLAPKGEAVLAQPGKPFILETSELQVRVDLAEQSYSQGDAPPNSFFSKMTIELVATPKAELTAFGASLPSDREMQARCATIEGIWQSPVGVLRTELPDETQVGLVVSEALQRIGTPAVDPLIVCLTDQACLRELATTILRRIGAPAVDSLIACLRDRAWLRQVAIEALGQIGDPRAVQPLTRLLKSRDQATRQATAAALGRIGDPQATKPLGECLRDRSQAVRQVAAKALGQIGGADIAPLLADRLADRSRQVRQTAAEALRQIGWDPPPDETGAAYWFALGETDRYLQIGTPAVAMLLERLHDRDDQVRQTAAQVLGQLKAEQALKPLVWLSRDKKENVRCAATQALGQIEHPTAVKPLLARLKDHSPQVRRAAVQALSRIGAPAIEPLVARLNGRDEDVRQGALDALQKMTDPQAVQALKERLRDTEAPTRLAAAHTLAQMEWEPTADAWGAAYWLALGQEDKCVKIGAPAVDVLIEQLDDRQPDTRRIAADVLGQIRDSRAIAPLVARLQDRDTNVCLAAVNALGRLGDTQAVAPLVELLRVYDRDVQSAAAMALKRIGDAETGASEAGQASEQEGDALPLDIQLVQPAPWELPPSEEWKWIGPPPLGHFITTYELGEDTYDESFSIETPDGEFLGECGVGISETIGTGEPDKVTAFEVWLYDKSDIRTITKVLMSDHAYHDEQLRAKLAAKGEAVPAQPGAAFTLETSSLRVQAIVTNMQYGEGQLPPRSFLSKLMIELIVMAKLETVAFSSPTLSIRETQATWKVLANEPGLALLDDTQMTQVAAEALRRIGAAAVDPLIACLADQLGPRKLAVRILTAKVLRRIGVPAETRLTVSLRNRMWLRQLAVETLGHIADPGAAQPLIKRLGDRDEKTRQNVATALGQIGDDRATAPLIRCLRDKSEAVRQAAAVALGQIGSTEATPLLVEHLADPSRIIRRTAAEALRRIGWPPLSDSTGARYWFALGETERCAEIAAEAVEVLREYLLDPDDGVRQGAVEALGKIGIPSATEPLVERLNDGDWQVRQTAAEALGRWRETRAVRALIQCLEDSDWHVQKAAMIALEQIGDAHTQRFLATYESGQHDYDEWFSIKATTGELLGKCGMRILQTLDSPIPGQVMTLEVWLLDRSDTHRVAKIVASKSHYHSAVSRPQLEATEELIPAEVGRMFSLQTSRLYVAVTVEEVVYDKEAYVPENAILARLTLQIVARTRWSPPG